MLREVRMGDVCRLVRCVLRHAFLRFRQRKKCESEFNISVFLGHPNYIWNMLALILLISHSRVGKLGYGEDICLSHCIWDGKHY